MSCEFKLATVNEIGVRVTEVLLYKNTNIAPDKAFLSIKK